MPADMPSVNRVASLLRRPREVALLGVLLCAATLWQPALAAPLESYDDTANCIAVMEVTADDLAHQVKVGDKARESELRIELVRAAALVGRVYFDGMRDEQAAKASLSAARERQKTWDAARRNGVHGACLKRADAELASASRTERFIVGRVAEGRMRRMLAGPQ